jgi:hypothetical protein
LPAGESLPVFLGDSALMREMRHRLEALSNGWNQWVLGYNASRQSELLHRLGLPDTDWPRLIGLLAAGAGSWVLYLVIRLWPRQAARDGLDTIWRNFCRKLARRGVARQPWETAGDFALRAALALPESADTISRIAESYATLRFGRTPPTTRGLRKLAQSVKQFRP